MDKHYNAASSEEKWFKIWEEKGLFKADPSSSKPSFSLLMPPPNLTGSLHLGHAMQHVILDAVARFKRMRGCDVLLLPGVDHAGIQFEGTLNRLLAKEGKSKYNMTREEWLERAWKLKDENYASFHKTWKVFGLSADWPKEVFTLEPKVEGAVFEEFKSFWEQGLLYKGAYIVQWCPKCGTAIEDVEMEYEEKKEKLYYLKYGPLTLATTRPETKFGDTAMAVNPQDARYKDLIGKEFEVITLNGSKKMRVIADDAIDPNFGTGAEKVTPGHDFLDYEIGKHHNLPIIHVIDKSGRLTEVAGKYAGMKVDEAREAMIPELEEKGILVKIADYTHSVPVCERCKTVIQPIISEEWFVKMKPLAQKALKRIGQIEFYPDSFKKTLSEWMEKIHDWSISRSLWWGYQIPVWYCQNCNSNHEVDKNKAMVVSLKKPAEKCPGCKASDWTQDEQVLDTWFSSGMWPLATLGWPRWETMRKYYPWDFELSSGEIKYLWIARMIMLGVWFSNEVPFKNMFFHGQIRDLQGRKFSKSLGNGIDPNELREKWGTDATRMALLTYTAPGRDGRASRQSMDERCKNFRNFSTKIWNIARFVLDKPVAGSQSLVASPPTGPLRRVGDEASEAGGQTEEETKAWILKYPKGTCFSEAAQAQRSLDYARDDKKGATGYRLPATSSSDDQWILDELSKLVANVTKNIDSFQLHLASEEIYDFVWHKFADIYIEKSKSRKEETQPILEHVLKTCLQLLHPFMPFLTEELWQMLLASSQTEKEATDYKLPTTSSIQLSSWPKHA